MAIEMTLASCHDGLRLSRKQVIHDRKVVWRKVPEYVDIVLKESKIHSGGIVVVEIAKRAFVDKLTDLSEPLP